MRQVREMLGQDAVILSNKRTAHGVEVVAATGYIKDRQAATPADRPQPQNPDRPGDFATALRHATPEDVLVEDTAPRQPAASPGVVWSQDPLLTELREEVRTVSGMLRRQLAGLAWGDVARRQPQRAQLLARLYDLGLRPDLCLQLADAAGAEPDPERAWSAALTALTDGLRLDPDGILSGGGLVALLGPTGVGKTTTAAKLAARHTQRHGPGQVALITTDVYRIGTFDQLRTFGMILDIPVRLAGDRDELRRALAEFSDRRLVLIDTAGAGRHDGRLTQQLELVGDFEQVRRHLVLAANAETAALSATAETFSGARLAGCIFTKLDETVRAGGLLTAAHDLRLPLHYLSDGQRIPEDLHAADRGLLLKLAEAPRPACPAGTEELLAMTFGEGLGNDAG